MQAENTAPTSDPPTDPVFYPYQHLNPFLKALVEVILKPDLKS
jgi:hypothetical protein